MELRYVALHLLLLNFWFCGYEVLRQLGDIQNSYVPSSFLAVCSCQFIKYLEWEAFNAWFPQDLVVCHLIILFRLKCMRNAILVFPPPLYYFVFVFTE